MECLSSQVSRVPSVHHAAQHPICCCPEEYWGDRRDGSFVKNRRVLRVHVFPRGSLNGICRLRLPHYEHLFLGRALAIPLIEIGRLGMSRRKFAETGFPELLAAINTCYPRCSTLDTSNTTCSRRPGMYPFRPIIGPRHF